MTFQQQQLDDGLDTCRGIWYALKMAALIWLGILFVLCA
jgi:hypothetical protein